MKPESFRVVETCEVCKFATFGWDSQISCTKHDFDIIEGLFDNDCNFVCDDFEKGVE